MTKPETLFPHYGAPAALWIHQKDAEFLRKAVCGVPDDQREDGDEKTLEYLLTELKSILCSFEPISEPTITN